MQSSSKKIGMVLLSALLLIGCSLPAKGVAGGSEVQPPGLFEVPCPDEKPLSTLLLDSEALKSCKCDYEKRLTVLVEDRTVLDEISKDVYQYSIMSSNAYDRALQIAVPGWKRIKRIVSRHGFSADVNVSSDQKEVVIAFRGTDDAKDWRYANTDTDANGQYQDADELFMIVKREHENKKIITTGHSLGGGLAIHVSLGNPGVDSYVFDPSPRIFAGVNYGKYDNRIVVVYESGEILSLIRPLFTTFRKVRHEKYRYNFLGGDAVAEHSIQAFSRCMYAAAYAQDSNYAGLCKDNTVGHDNKSNP